MMNYQLLHWWAIDHQGNPCDGEMLVSHRQQLCHRLLAEGRVLLKAKRRGYYRPRDWRRSQQVLLFQQTAILLRAGLPLSEGLQLLADGHPLKQWRALLHQLRQEIMNGSRFSVALSQWSGIFPPLVLAMVRAGEDTGQLDHCCQRLADQQQRQTQLQRQIISALRYPLFILLLTLSLTFGMLLWVLPEFAAIYRSANTPLPAFTRALITFSQSLLSALPAIACLLALLLCLWQGLRRRHPGWQLAEQKLLFRLPLAGALWQSVTLAQLFALLTLTQRSGLPLTDGLNTAAGLLTTRFWHQQLTALLAHIRMGHSLSSGLQPLPGFPPLCYLLIRSGEQTGQLESLFEHLSDWYETDARQKSALLSSSIEPLMLIVTGGMTGAMVIALYLPMFSLGDALL